MRTVADDWLKQDSCRATHDQVRFIIVEFLEAKSGEELDTLFYLVVGVVYEKRDERSSLRFCFRREVFHHRSTGA